MGLYRGQEVEIEKVSHPVTESAPRTREPHPLEDAKVYAGGRHGIGEGEYHQRRHPEDKLGMSGQSWIHRSSLWLL